MAIIRNLGGAGIAPAGANRAEVPRGAYEGTIIKVEDRASRKNPTNQGLVLMIRVDDPTTVGDFQTGGIELETWSSWTEPEKGFDDKTDAGKANRARAAELKSIIASTGQFTPEQLIGVDLGQVDWEQLNGQKVRFFYEPSIPNVYQYPAFTYLTPDLYKKTREGKHQVRLRNDPTKVKAGGGAPGGAPITFTTPNTAAPAGAPAQQVGAPPSQPGSAPAAAAPPSLFALNGQGGGGSAPAATKPAGSGLLGIG